MAIRYRWDLTLDGRAHVVELEQKSGRTVIRVNGRIVVDRKPFVDTDRWSFPFAGSTATLVLVSTFPREWALQVRGEPPRAGTRLTAEGRSNPVTPEQRRQAKRLLGLGLLGLGALLLWLAGPQPSSDGSIVVSPKVAVAAVMLCAVGGMMALGFEIDDQQWRERRRRTIWKVVIYAAALVGLAIGLYLRFGPL